jgi:hypothetical protein
MAKKELENLLRIGTLKQEAPSRAEYDGTLAAARTSLIDAQKDLDPDSKFTLAYGAAHRLALAALRHEGYRSEDRISLSPLVHALGTGAADIQAFLKPHNARNLAEYQGHVDVGEKLLADLIRCTKTLEAAVARLARPEA